MATTSHELRSTDDIDSEARESPYLSSAPVLIASLFGELQGLKEHDAILSHDLTIEAPAISEQLAALHDIVDRLPAAQDGSDDLELIERGKAILGLF